MRFSPLRALYSEIPFQINPSSVIEKNKKNWKGS
jgi:hypothetical protein